MSTESQLSVSQHFIQVGRPSVDTQLTLGQYVSQHTNDTLIVMLQSTVGHVLVARQWYMCIVNCCLTEMAAVS